MEQVMLAPKLYFYLEGKTSLKNIMEYAAAKVQLANAEAERMNMEKTGPMEFIYFGATYDLEKEITLQIGFPVKSEKPIENGFRFRKSQDFKCLTNTYKGEMANSGNKYESLFEYMWDNSIKSSNEIREVYRCFEFPDSPNNVTEIQIGLV